MRSTPSVTPSQNIAIRDFSSPTSNQSNMPDKNGSTTKANINNNQSSTITNSNSTFKPIPAFGPRAEEMVRSYENAYLVSRIVPFERKFNRLVKHIYKHTHI